MGQQVPGRPHLHIARRCMDRVCAKLGGQDHRGGGKQHRLGARTSLQACARSNLSEHALWHACRALQASTPDMHSGHASGAHSRNVHIPSPRGPVKARARTKICATGLTQYGKVLDGSWSTRRVLVCRACAPTVRPEGTPKVHDRSVRGMHAQHTCLECMP